ncbi:ABC transporter substrate-binding protein [Desulfallas thermosapovorans]|uniref:Glycine betaine/proline transport system substrate-binding protein n=1 Tax=Desulfallas thermosapovorans DSM 6562 TaxID=1121431 RepID=A0A5S4ZVM8_9FIRM|nr:ABC transporter substrate-binding protein [Desulfallas thermosapovorans]TYO96856.1 glycine betaine/proline transport system substrate-binding protein [Desulfallas thermosapovorans DSM 6562]
MLFKGGVKFSDLTRIGFVLMMLLVFSLVATVGCSSENETGDVQQGAKEAIMFGDFNWESALVNNRIAQFIIENGYEYPTDSIPGETIPLMQGLRNGDIDVAMEIWVQNAQEAYDKGIESGDYIDLGTNFNDDVQGLYVPTYMIEGDPERGIEPMAPDLKTIEDLPKYWELFKDPEDPGKGRFYGAVPGWEADEILVDKFASYGLDEYYNIFRPGSGASLASSIVSAYQKGEPWFGYYWEPTWVFGLYDLTQIHEPEYSDELWENGYACAFPSVDVNIVINKDLPERAPDVVEFLDKYSLNSNLISEVLAYMQRENTEAEEAALWFLREKADVWTNWVPSDVAQKVQEKL